jgi:hypothetical protein
VLRGLLAVLVAGATGFITLQVTPAAGRSTPGAPPSSTKTPPPGRGDTLAAWPATIPGRVLDQHERPLAGASIVHGGIETRTGADGTLTIPAVAPATPLLVKLPGHEKATIEPRPGPVEARLRPQAIKAAYLTYFGFGDRDIRQRVLDLATRTELNAVVIDVKGDRGWVIAPRSPWPSPPARRGRGR